MSIFQKGASILGRLLVVAALGATFLAGMLGVFYLSLKGEEVEIPKIVGKNLNSGSDELASMGLRIKKIATRYSEEEPNTILEQRPRAGTPAKTGLMVSVIVSQPNPDSTEAPAEVIDDDEAIEEIEELPELKTDKAKKKSRKKPSKKVSSKTRDVIEKDPKKDKTDPKVADSKTDPKNIGDTAGPAAKPTDAKTKSKKPPVAPKPNNPKTNNKPPVKKNGKKPKTAGDTRSRKVP